MNNVSVILVPKWTMWDGKGWDQDQWYKDNKQMNHDMIC